MSKYARKKGHDFERQIAREFKELGFPDARTTRKARGGDWSLTDEGKDLQGTWPYAVQCKRTKAYVSVSTIEEVKCGKRCVIRIDGFARETNKNADWCCDAPPEKHEWETPIVITQANNKEPMAIIPWKDLKKLLDVPLR